MPEINSMNNNTNTRSIDEELFRLVFIPNIDIFLGCRDSDVMGVFYEKGNDNELVPYSLAERQATKLLSLTAECMSIS